MLRTFTLDEGTLLVTITGDVRLQLVNDQGTITTLALSYEQMSEAEQIAQMGKTDFLSAGEWPYEISSVLDPDTQKYINVTLRHFGEKQITAITMPWKIWHDIIARWKQESNNGSAPYLAPHAGRIKHK